jgi:uncharacterized membrane protein YraQ (UPF0718 family)
MSSEAKTKRNTIIILTAIAGIIIGIIIGLAIAKLSLSKSEDQADTQKMASKPIDDSFFNDQSAMITGKVKTVSNSSITVFNANGKEATFPINDKIILSKQGSNQKTVTGTIADIKTEDFVIINLKKTTGNYYVYSIVILPPIGTPPPPPVIR